MDDLIIFGIGQIAEVFYSYLKRDSNYNIKGFTVDKEYLDNNKIFGLPVVPWEEVESNFPPNKFKLLTAISYKENNIIRRKKYQEGKEKGYKFGKYISSDAYVHEEVNIGENCFIFENNVIQPFVDVGNNVIIWSGNHIGHHTKIEDNCFIASHAVISGSVNIGKNSFIGVNTTIRDNINIGENNIIGAGAIILRSTKKKSVYMSKPTKKHPLDSDKVKI